MSTQPFDTRLVLSAAIGIGVSDKLMISDLQRLVSHVLGYPVFTHEVGRSLKDCYPRLCPLFDNLPDRAVLMALPADERMTILAGVVDAALARYGDTVMIGKGVDTREVHPLDTLNEIAPASSPVVIAVQAPVT